MEIIIAGFVLLIIGVGLTYVYDHYKENKSSIDAALNAKVESAKKSIQAQIYPDKTSRRRSVHDTNEAFLETFSKGIEKRNKTLKSQTPIRQKKVLNREMTVAEMIAKLEEMKKK